MSFLAKYAANSLRSQAKVNEFNGKSAGFERTLADFYDDLADKNVRRRESSSPYSSQQEQAILEQTRQFCKENPRRSVASTYTKTKPKTLRRGVTQIILGVIFLLFYMAAIFMPSGAGGAYGSAILCSLAIFCIFLTTFILALLNPEHYKMKSKFDALIKFFGGGTLLSIVMVGIATAVYH